MAGDWLRLYRKSLDSRVFSDDWLWRLWCWCLMQACWKTTWKDGREIQPGQFAMGRNEAADRLKVSPSKLYRGLHTLSDWGQIRLEANNRFTVVTICNWRTYQPSDSEEWTTDEQQMNNKRTASEHLADTPLIREEGKKERPSPTPSKPERGRAVDSLDPLFSRFWDAYPNHVARMEAARVWDELNVDEQLLATMLRTIEAWKPSEQWQSRKIPKPANWLRNGQWEDAPPHGTQPPPPSEEEIQARIQRERAKEEQSKTGCLLPQEARAKIKKITHNLGAMPDEH